MAKYAEQTTVPISSSKAQIEDTFLRYGIDEFGFGTSPRGDGIIFKKDKKVYKLNVPNPNPKDYKTEIKYQQAKRQRWRILLLSLKAKLEEIEAGLISFEDQFLAYMTLPDGSSIADFIKLPENQEKLEKSKMPKLLMA